LVWYLIARNSPEEHSLVSPVNFENQSRSPSSTSAEKSTSFLGPMLESKEYLRSR